MTKRPYTYLNNDLNTIFAMRIIAYNHDVELNKTCAVVPSPWPGFVSHKYNSTTSLYMLENAEICVCKLTIHKCTHV